MEKIKKTVLITGASSGMGKATAGLLAVSGYVVYGAARRVEKMDDLRPAGVIPLFMDVTDDASMVKAVERIVRERGRIDILVNDAGYGQYGTVEDVPIQEARRQFEVNLFGAARLTQLVLPHMRAARAGRIVNITSIGGKMATPIGGWYYSSKFAFEGLSDALRGEVRPFGIDVVIIEPGIMKTQWPGIAAENMMKVSAGSAYGALLEKGKAMLNRFDVEGSDPQVIARLIHKVIGLRRPKPRYAKGYLAKSTLFAKRWFSDRYNDRMILRKSGLDVTVK